MLGEVAPHLTPRASASALIIFPADREPNVSWGGIRPYHPDCAV